MIRRSDLQYQRLLQALSETGIHLWHLDLDATSSCLEQYRAVLDVAERNRATRFYRRRDEHRYITAHGVLRHILGRYLHRSPIAVSISALKFGKPVLSDSSLEFSLSHSDSRGVIAIARRQVGVDIERLRPIPDVVDLSQRFFSRLDALHISTCPAESRSVEFLRYWTFKEAYLKACGLGLSVPLESVPTPVKEFKGRISDHDRQLNVTTRWMLHQFQLKRDYVGAIAVNGGFDRVEEFHWERSS